MNILLTSVGRRSYLVKYFKEVLGVDGEVHVSNSTNDSPAFLVADKSVVTPLIYDDEYIPFLLSYCEKNKIDAVISVFDIDLPVLSKNKSLFESKNIKVIVSDKEIIDVCNDKWLTYLFFKESKVSVPHSYIDLDSAVADIEKGIISFPLIIKPRWGMGSMSIFEVDDIEELIVLYKKVKKGIFSSYLKYESGIDDKHSILIQEKIIGQEYGLDIINNLKGDNKAVVVKKKIAMRAGETDIAVVEENPTLSELGVQIAHMTKHIGNMDIDIILSDKNAYIIDMNARIGGGYPFSHMAGVNLPKALLQWINDDKEDEECFKIHYGVKCQKDLNIVML